MLSSCNGATQAEVVAIVAKYENKVSNLLPILQEVQSKSSHNYIPKETAFQVADAVGVPIVKVSSVISFFSALSYEPRGKNVIKICKSTACLVNGYKTVLAMLEEKLNIAVGETTADGLFSLEFTECIGACDVSPAIRINEEVFGNLSEEKLTNIIESFRA